MAGELVVDTYIRKVSRFWHFLSYKYRVLLIQNNIYAITVYIQAFCLREDIAACIACKTSTGITGFIGNAPL